MSTARMLLTPVSKWHRRQIFGGLDRSHGNQPCPENTKQTIHLRKEDSSLCGVSLKYCVELTERLKNEDEQH